MMCRGRWLSALLVVCLLVLGLLMFFEESLIFFPARYPDGDWEPAALPVEDIWFEAADGTRLHGWFVSHPRPKAVVLFAHGNAGNLSHRVEMLRRFHQTVEANILIFDYRGYGRSGGTPNEEGVLLDARAARGVLAKLASVDPAEVVLLGRSLGGAVVIDLAASEGARALILESTFTSLPEVAQRHYPWIPVSLLMRTRFDSRKKITRYRGPLLQSHSERDEIVPFSLGQSLFEVCPSDQKQFIRLPALSHNDPQPDSYYQAIQVFLDQLAP